MRVARGPQKADEHNIKDDMLSEEEWDEIRQLKDLLAPFKEATKRLEGASNKGAFGSLWEALVCLKMMLLTLEAKKVQLSHQPNSHLKAYVNLAWKKINNYY